MGPCLRRDDKKGGGRGRSDFRIGTLECLLKDQFAARVCARHNPAGGTVMPLGTGARLRAAVCPPSWRIAAIQERHQGRATKLALDSDKAGFLEPAERAVFGVASEAELLQGHIAERHLVSPLGVRDELQRHGQVQRLPRKSGRLCQPIASRAVEGAVGCSFIGWRCSGDRGSRRALQRSRHNGTHSRSSNRKSKYGRDQTGLLREGKLDTQCRRSKAPFHARNIEQMLGVQSLGKSSRANSPGLAARTTGKKSQWDL